MPPAFVPMLPPITEAAREEGSGAKRRPCRRASRSSTAFGRPDCTSAVRSSMSSSRMACMRLKAITRPPRVGTVAPVSDVPPPRAMIGTAVLARDAHRRGDVRARLRIDQGLGPPDHVRGVARHGGELGGLGVHAVAERRLQRCHPGVRHAATMRGTAGSKRSTSRWMRPSPAKVQRARAAIAAGRPAAALPVGRQHAVRRQAQAPEAQRGLRREPSERRVERSRVRPAGQRERAGRGEVRLRGGPAGRAEGALEGAHEGLGVGGVERGPVGERELAARFGVRRVERGAQRAGGRPAAARQRALEARARRLQVGAGRQREAERVAGLLAAGLVAVGGVRAGQHERDLPAVGVPVRAVPAGRAPRAARALRSARPARACARPRASHPGGGPSRPRRSRTASPGDRRRSPSRRGSRPATPRCPRSRAGSRATRCRRPRGRARSAARPSRAARTRPRAPAPARARRSARRS